MSLIPGEAKQWAHALDRRGLFHTRYTACSLPSRLVLVVGDAEATCPKCRETLVDNALKALDPDRV